MSDVEIEATYISPLDSIVSLMMIREICNLMLKNITLFHLDPLLMI